MERHIHSIITGGHQFVDKLMREVVMDNSAQYDREEIIRAALSFSYVHLTNHIMMNSILLPSGREVTSLDEIRHLIFGEIQEAFEYGTDWEVMYQGEVAQRDLLFLVTKNNKRL